MLFSTFWYKLKLDIMAQISESAKARIDSLPEQEIRHEIERGRTSRFQREKYAYLKVRLAEIELAFGENTGEGLCLYRHHGGNPESAGGRRRRVHQR